VLFVDSEEKGGVSIATRQGLCVMPGSCCGDFRRPPCTLRFVKQIISPVPASVESKEPKLLVLP
jgi:hypothetical protein